MGRAGTNWNDELKSRKPQTTNPKSQTQFPKHKLVRGGTRRTVEVNTYKKKIYYEINRNIAVSKEI
jgi:hypothetical protein